tara:strand:- start:756 stop:1379 length:624 start_codon:yes stop_codon:yes gene_type:complete
MNNINLIEDFLYNKNDGKLIINQVSEEIGVLYRSIIDYFCKKINLKIVKSVISETDLSQDLFNERKLYIHYSNNKKNIDSILEKKDQFIIFSDYKIYKTFKRKILSINGYEYQKDIEYYLRNELKINNFDIISFCINNPQLVLSETSKFLVNSEGYVVETRTNEKNNFILEIRKELYSLINNNGRIKPIYENLKKEVKYKKFNFLAY